jgi:hypothetical protein
MFGSSLKAFAKNPSLALDNIEPMFHFSSFSPVFLELLQKTKERHQKVEILKTATNSYLNFLTKVSQLRDIVSELFDFLDNRNLAIQTILGCVWSRFPIDEASLLLRFCEEVVKAREEQNFDISLDAEQILLLSQFMFDARDQIRIPATSFFVSAYNIQTAETIFLQYFNDPTAHRVNVV